MKKHPQRYSAQITIQEHTLPVEVVIERRRGVRFSITAKKVFLRLPSGTAAHEVHAELAKLQTWVDGLAAKKPGILQPFVAKSYDNGSTLTVGQRKYQLLVSDEERATNSARLHGQTIVVQLSNKATPTQRTKAIRTLLSRVVASDQYRDVADRVHDINRRTFNRPIRNVYLKYNHSNWGSCSRDGNVNLSTRLLFAPQKVQDYVILHELAHLVEMNHSDRFWALVARYMPDYPEQERWLKDHGNTCDF